MRDTCRAAGADPTILPFRPIPRQKRRIPAHTRHSLPLLARRVLVSKFPTGRERMKRTTVQIIVTLAGAYAAGALFGLMTVLVF